MPRFSAVDVLLAAAVLPSKCRYCRSTAVNMLSRCVTHTDILPITCCHRMPHCWHIYALTVYTYERNGQILDINVQKNVRFGHEFACSIGHYAHVEHYARFEHILKLRIMLNSKICLNKECINNKNFKLHKKISDLFVF